MRLFSTAVFGREVRHRAPAARGSWAAKCVFFYHDSDHDPRETQTTLRHRKTGEPTTLNFAFVNKVQRKWSPLFAKRVAPDWQANTARHCFFAGLCRWPLG